VRLALLGLHLGGAGRADELEVVDLRAVGQLVVVADVAVLVLRRLTAQLVQRLRHVLDVDRALVPEDGRAVSGGGVGRRADRRGGGRRRAAGGRGGGRLAGADAACDGGGGERDGGHAGGAADDLHDAPAPAQLDAVELGGADQRAHRGRLLLGQLDEQPAAEF